jgi:hypothetical protein
LRLCAAACLVVAACDDNGAPQANEAPGQSGATPGEPVARAPENPDGLADTVARTLVAMLANGDQETMERYRLLFDSNPHPMWVYEDETHTFGSRLPDFYLHVADWMRDALEGRFEPGYARRIDHPAR